MVTLGVTERNGIEETLKQGVSACLRIHRLLVLEAN